MFARLLIGLDGSAGSAAALEAAIALGVQFRSTIVLAAIVDVNVLEAPLLESTASGWPDGFTAAPATFELGEVLRERAERLLDAGATKVQARGLEAQTVNRVGLVDDELLALAEDVEALVIGRHGGPRAPAAIGDHTIAMVRHASRPVVVAGDRPSAFTKPVVAYDGGETSAAALALAGRYADATQVAVDVVHVSDAAAAGEAMLARAGAFLSREAVAYDTHRLTGDIAVAVAKYVERSGCDVLVCGARGGRRRSWSMGSQAERLLRATGVPVIVVR